MLHPTLPLTHDLVMIGGGHTHALVLRKWGMNPLPGARLTVIHPGPTAPYSGMLPGYVAGHYDRDALDIDLVRLARFAGARVICGAASGIDLNAREVHVPGRPPVGYDLLSVNVGITSDMPSMPGFAKYAIPAKPLGPFAAQWADFLAAQAAGNIPGKVAVIGGGVAGAELAMAMANALDLRGRTGTSVTIIDSSKALSVLGENARSHIRTAMADLGIYVFEDAEISAIHADHVALADGREIPSYFTTGTAGARALDWLSETGLALNDGFITVDATLRSSDENVFGAGDCVHLSASPRPKAGVYAVREAPILYHNLRAIMTGDPLRSYAPQDDYLKLVSLGTKSALAEKFGRVFSGPLMWRWKNRIDQTFMEQFRTLPEMKAATIPAMHTMGLIEAIGDKPLCGGCGAKVGRAALRSALAALPASTRDDIQMLPGDDAAVLLTGGARQVITTDHLRRFTDDPVLMARIAANHALGDIWAMGAAPQAATATLILPRLTPALQARTLHEIITAAGEVIHSAGGEIVGGHTSVGDDLTIGFTITGLSSGDPITLAGGQAGDALILTKPLGSGVLMAAEMAGLARGEWVLAGFDLMQQSQGRASQILAKAHAMTDVTGFGLAGHLMGICEESNLAGVLDLARIPTMSGTVELATSGVQSTLFNENRTLAPGLPATGKAALLFDPQTAGGLLAAVAPDQADALVKRLCDAGYTAAKIGVLSAGAPNLTLS